MPTAPDMKKALDEARALKKQAQDARLERVKKLYAQGDDMTDAEIARSMGIPVKSVFTIRTRLGLPVKGKEGRRQFDLSRKAGGFREDKRRRLPKLRRSAKPVLP